MDNYRNSFFLKVIMDGLHLTLDIYHCRRVDLLNNSQQWSDMSDRIRRHQFTVMGQLIHEFEGGGFTGTWLLAESHVAVHTWPEKSGCTIDIYACDVSKSHDEDVKALAFELIAWLEATQYHVQTLHRGQNPTHSDFVCSNAGLHYRGPVLHTHQSPFQRIDVIDSDRYGRSLKLDGILMSTEKDEFMYHEAMVHAPILLAQQPRRLMVIGGGDLGSIREAAKHPQLQRIDLAELDQAVTDLTLEWGTWVSKNLLDDPRIRCTYDDGLKTFQAYSQEELYDVVILDLTDPGVMTNHLYGVNGLQLLQDGMSKGGVLSCHLGLGMEAGDRVEETLRQLAEVFPYVQVYQTMIPSYGGLWLMACASQEPLDWSRVSMYSDWKDLHNKSWTSWTDASIGVHPLVYLQHPLVKEYSCNSVM